MPRAVARYAPGAPSIPPERILRIQGYSDLTRVRPVIRRAAEHRARSGATCAKIRTELWDETRGIFANRLRSGAFVRSLGPTSFYPLVAGAATEAQVDRLVGHLADPATFGGEPGIPGTARDDPAAKDNVYWRGRIWPPLNTMVWHGLRRYGRNAEASRLAATARWW